MAISPGWDERVLHSRIDRCLDIDLAKDRLELGHRLRQIRTQPLRIGASILDVGYKEEILNNESLIGYATDPSEVYTFAQKLKGIWVGAVTRHEQRTDDGRTLEQYLAQAALTTPTFLGFDSVTSLHATVASAARIRAERSRLYEPARAAVIPIYEGYPDMPDAQWRHEARMLAVANLPVMLGLQNVFPDEDLGGYGYMAINQLQLAHEKYLPAV